MTNVILFQRHILTLEKFTVEQNKKSHNKAIKVKGSE